MHMTTLYKLQILIFDTRSWVSYTGTTCSIIDYIDTDNTICTEFHCHRAVLISNAVDAQLAVVVEPPAPEAAAARHSA